MSELRVYVKDKDGKEMSFVVHYGMGCRLVSAINEKTDDLESLLKSAYEFDKDIYSIKSCRDGEFKFDEENKFTFSPKVSKEPYDAGIIEIYFPEKMIISNQDGDYICHRGVRQTWGYTGPHLDVGRFKRFSIPEDWTIFDKFFFGITVKVEGEIDKELERRLMERVECYRKMGYKVEVL